jgi:hypothetical protein
LIRFLLKFYVGLVIDLVVLYGLWRFVFERGHVGPPTVGCITTRVTGPVRPNGYIDYFAASNEIRDQGIAPQENAALDLLRATGPYDRD